MTKLNAGISITGTDNLTVGDFWAWAYSDILNNANRGIFAEFLVASALDISDVSRIEWNEIDLIYRQKAIEVKSAAYCQSWSQTGLSKISFGIAETIGWNAATNTYRTEAGRASDCYVFCLYKEQEFAKAREHLLDVSFWDFYVVPTPQLIARFGAQKTVGLNSLRTLCQPVAYHHLKMAVEQALELMPDAPDS